MGDQRACFPKPVLQRMPQYLNYLRTKQEEGLTRISSTIISADLKLSPIQVRKDLSLVNDSGKPRTGFDIRALVKDIERLLGYDQSKRAVLMGVGHLGRALMAYDGFAGYGLDIVAAFDTDPSVAGTQIHGKPVYAAEELLGVVARLNVHMGILTVPAHAAQACCDHLVAAGIMAIWNFAPAHLDVPERVILQNEDIAASLAVLSNKLQEKSKFDE